MRVLSKGRLMTFDIWCPCCNAHLEFTQKDLVKGTGKLIPVKGYRDTYLDYPVATRDYGNELVEWVLEKYNNDYVESGHYSTLDGVIRCAECENEIDLRNDDNAFTFFDNIYPSAKIIDDYNNKDDNYEAHCGYVKGQSEEVMPHIKIHRKHIKEYNDMKNKWKPKKVYKYEK